MAKFWGVTGGLEGDDVNGDDMTVTEIWPWVRRYGIGYAGVGGMASSEVEWGTRAMRRRQFYSANGSFRKTGLPTISFRNDEKKISVSCNSIEAVEGRREGGGKNETIPVCVGGEIGMESKPNNNG
ncbi:hypothetical protein LXL04_020456 [Taraxacum kok-saghyz]